MERFITANEKRFVEQGGFRENLFKKRLTLFFFSHISHISPLSLITLSPLTFTFKSGHDDNMPRPLIILLLGLGIITFAGFNIWLFSAGSGATKISIPSPFNNAPRSSQPPNPSFTATTTPSPTSTPVPTPTPLQGPGRYACAPEGVCNDYSDEMRKNCPVTFADRNCLGQCQNPAKRCQQ